MPANRRQRRAAVARARRNGRTQTQRRRSVGERLALGVVGAALVALPFVLVGGLRGHAFPRGLLLMPVFGCALIVLALR